MVILSIWIELLLISVWTSKITTMIEFLAIPGNGNWFTS